MIDAAAIGASSTSTGTRADFGATGDRCPRNAHGNAQVEACVFPN